MQKVDIRKLKNDLRNASKVYRKGLSASEKSQIDSEICDKLLNCKGIIESQTVVCYVSTEIEVDTRVFIQKMLDLKKTVAIPKCISGTRKMEFYIIKSFDDTENGSFGVLEPKDTCEKLRDFRKSVCIIPGLCFDTEGFRLGYGKGYYDRFLSLFKGLKIGICYDYCMKDVLPRGFFDVSADMVITEKQIIDTK